MSGGPPLRVVHLVTALGYGGAERHVELLARAAVTAGREVRVLVLQRGGPLVAGLRAAGVVVEEFDGGDPVGARRRSSLVLRLARRLRELAPDVVHVHLLSAQLHGLPAARLAGVPAVVSSEHSLMDAEIEGMPLTRSLRWTYRVLERLADVTVAVSARTRDRLVALGVRHDRIRVVENAVDLRGFAFDPVAREQVRAEWGVATGERVVLTAGRLEAQKRTGVVVRGVRGLLDDRTRLVVVGAGSERAALEELAAAAGDRIRFLGPRADVARVLNGADVFVSASRDETFGMALVEAASAGLPVVFGACPALTRLVEAGEDPRRAGWHALPELAPGTEPGGQAEVDGFTSTLRPVLASALERVEPPRSLFTAYGTERLAADLDALYLDLVRRSPRRRAVLRGERRGTGRARGGLGVPTPR